MNEMPDLLSYAERHARLAILFGGSFDLAAVPTFLSVTKFLRA
jgi:hypothetical protein